MCTYSSGKGKLEVVRPECIVFNCSLDDFIEEIGLAEDIFRHTKPKTEELYDGANQHETLLVYFCLIVVLSNTKKHLPALNRSYDHTGQCPISTSSLPSPVN